MTRQIHVGDVAIGGGAPVSIQSMLNTKTTDAAGCLAQLAALKAAGCQIARLAVPNMAAAQAFGEIAAQSPLPLVADIHFDYRLAIAAAQGGAAKIRINPGNIGSPDRVRAVAEVCRAKHIPIRIGVNGGSLDKALLEKYGHPTAEALWKAPFPTWRFWKPWISGTCVCPSNPRRCPPWWPPPGCSASGATIPCTSASRKPARCAWA